MPSAKAMDAAKEIITHVSGEAKRHDEEQQAKQKGGGGAGEGQRKQRLIEEVAKKLDAILESEGSEEVQGGQRNEDKTGEKAGMEKEGAGGAGGSGGAAGSSSQSGQHQQTGAQARR